MTVRKSCATCGRTVFDSGGHTKIEAARDQQGQEPATTFIQDLEAKSKGRRATRSKQESLDRLADIADRFDRYARTGNLRVPRELNDLGNGIREIKAGDVRLAFSEKDGGLEGLLTRLTNCWIKTGRWAIPRDIRRATAIRKADDCHGESL